MAEIKAEKDKAKELDEKLKEWEKKMRSTRKEVGGSNIASNFTASSTKQEKVLENRLDQVIEIFQEKIFFKMKSNAHLV